MTTHRMKFEYLKCKQCGTQFKSTRYDARFCSARCRKRSQRGVTELPAPKSVTEIRKSVTEIYLRAIYAIRELYELCDPKQPNITIESMYANSHLNLIRRAAFDAESDSVFRRRAAGGLSNSSSPLDPEFDKQFKHRM